jgi:hypothetical protein
MQALTILIPLLTSPAVIDGNLSEWKDRAFTDGAWDIHRVAQSPWYDGGKRNRLTLHAGEKESPEDDLSARYYMAWDSKYLYLGAEVKDNVNDVTDPAHEDKRWYFKDAICWFVETPRDTKAESFGEGDNAFCFVVDPKKPKYGAWWRHGDATRKYIEEPLKQAQYAIKMHGHGGDFTLEARVELPNAMGAEYSVEVVHTDPDGGGYGGHLMIWGNGDDDSTWTPMRLVGPKTPVVRMVE